MTDLTDLLGDILRLPASQISDATTMADTDSWDSLAHMDLMGALEETYEITLSADDMVEMTSVAAIRAVLAKHGVTAS
ncbi:hypothetical protein CCR80_08210 [Rhodothalassium salexigens]|uniref:acyl carrier protein n=1 Tax=Rhodothalassium salexigens TaxID=1086 RepID=UPI00191225FE|nr:acyl carrier protein [Rhodothalassium salexigens]MBK5921013.1 hypothetical protein [Rhodothalassium salexigens]